MPKQVQRTRDGAKRRAAAAPTTWRVYLVRCADGSLYGGVTTDPARRTAMHNTGTGARYTRARRPVVLAWASAPLDKVTAHRLEWRVKRLERASKLRLAAGAGRALVHRLLADLQPQKAVTRAQPATTSGAGTPQRTRPTKATKAKTTSRG